MRDWTVNKWAILLALLALQAVNVVHALDHNPLTDLAQDCDICLHSASGGDNTPPVEHDYPHNEFLAHPHYTPVPACVENRTESRHSIRAPPVF